MALQFPQAVSDVAGPAAPISGLTVVGPFLGWCTLVGVGSLNALHVCSRYTAPLNQFLVQQGLHKPSGVVQQLKKKCGIRSYAEMHINYLLNNHEWLLHIPAPNRQRIACHLQDTSKFLLRSVALPLGFLCFYVRHAALTVSAWFCEPIVSSAANVANSNWTKQEVLELITISSTLLVLWQLSAGVMRSRSFRAQIPRVTFDEVIGLQAAKAQVEMYVRFLQSPEHFTRLGARMPKGCLFAGPPGTGKTYLAKAVAGTAGVPFFAASGSDFMELYVGQGARSVRELFKAARKASPSVIFIDELDAVGCKRNQMETTGEHTRTINQLLAEMDGMAQTDVVIFAATNRIDFLDSALLRPGRFDKVVYMDIPDSQCRENLFSFYMSKLALIDPDDNSWCQKHETLADAEITTRRELAKHVAARTQGLTPAHVSTICNEAALIAATAGDCFVGKRHFDRAVEESLHGVHEERRVSPPELD